MRYLTLFIYCFLCFTSLYGQQIVTVNPSGSGDYTTVQEALDAFSNTTLASDVVIRIASGEYDEPLSLTGVNPSENNYSLTLESASGNAADVIITNTTPVSGPTDPSVSQSNYQGILKLTEVSNVTIRNLTFTEEIESDYAVGICGVSNQITLSGNAFNNTSGADEYAIHQLYEYYYLIDFANFIFETRDTINHISNLTVEDNTFNRLGLYRNSFSSDDEDDDIPDTDLNFTFRGNEINNSDLNGNWTNIRNLVINQNTWTDVPYNSNYGQITNFQFTNNILENSNLGYIYNSDSILISDNKASSQRDILTIAKSDNILISNNKMSSQQGILSITNSDTSLVSTYTITNNFFSSRSLGINILAEDINLTVAFNNFNLTNISGGSSAIGITVSAIDETERSSLSFHNNNYRSASDKSFGYSVTFNESDVGSINTSDLPFVSDHNNFYFAGADQLYKEISLSTFVQDTLTLQEVRDNYGLEINSLSTDPLYFSETDLHIGNAGLRGKGKAIPGITTDIDGETRQNPPDIGADELGALSANLRPVVIENITGTLEGGKNIQLDYTVQNTGQLALATNWTDGIYLSTDAALSNDDTLLHTELVEQPLGLEPQGTYQRRVAFGLPTNVQAGTYYLLLDVNSEAKSIEGNDTDNTLSSVSLSISEAQLPDLQVTDIVTPSSEFSGKAVEVSWTVTNSGNSITNQPWQDYIYFANVESALDGGPKDSLLVVKVASPTGLAPGESYTNTKQVNIPVRYSGTLYYRVRANGNQTLPEIDTTYTDNGLTSSVITVTQSPLPDLAVTNLNFSGTAFSGETIPVNWTVENVGQQITYRTATQLFEEDWLNRANFNYWTDRVYISRKPFYDEEEPTQRVVATYYRPTEELDVAQDYTINDSINFQDCDYGKYYVFVVANQDGYTFELDYDNNISVLDSVEVVIDPKPDLVPEQLAVTNALSTGNFIDIDFTVANNGFSDTKGERIGDYFFLSALDTFIVNQSKLLGSNFYRDTVVQDGQYSQQVVFELPYNLYGNLYLYHVTDYVDNICEIDGESNNINRIPVNVSLSDQPDLVPEFVSFPANMVAGNAYSVVYRVQNSGPGDAAQTGWQDALFLNGVKSRSARRQPVLPSGAGYQDTLRFTLPVQATEGTLELTLASDFQRSLVEFGGEDNNEVSAEVTVTRNSRAVADLAISNLNVTENDITAGDTVTLTYTITNESAATPQSGWLDRLIILDDEDNTVLARDLRHFGIIENNQQSAESYRVVLPYNLAGDYRFGVTLNSNLDLPEYNGNNNDDFITKTVAAYIPPDLEITDITFPGCCNRFALQEDTVELTVLNNGPGKLDGLPVDFQFALARDPQGTSSRTLANETVTLTLNSGNATTVQVPVKYPYDLSGDYYAIAFTDRENKLFEGGQDNNNRYATGYTINVNNDPVSLRPSSLTITSTTDPKSSKFLTVNYRVEKGTGTALKRTMQDQLIVSEQRAVRGNYYIFPGVTGQRSLSESDGFYEDNFITSLPRDIPPGWYYVGVKVDARNNVLEPDESDNVLFTTDSIYIDFSIPLELDNPLTLSFLEGALGPKAVFRLERPAEKGMQVTLDFSNDQAQTELYHRVANVPTRSVFDTRYNDPFLADQELIVPVTDTATTDFFTLIANRVPWINDPLSFINCPALVGFVSGRVLNTCPVRDTVPYTLLAESKEYSILRTYPDSASYYGVSNLLIEGFDFEEGMSFFMVNEGDTIHGSDVFVESSTEAVVRFDFREQPTGVYDLVALKNGTEKTTLTGYFTIFEGSAPIPFANVEQSVGRQLTGQNITVNVDFGNRAHINGYDFWLIVAFTNDTFNPSSMQTTYIGSSSEDVQLQLEENLNPVADSAFVDVDGTRYYAYWIPVLPPRSQTTFSYSLSNPEEGYVLAQAYLYQQQLSNFQLQQNHELSGESVTLRKALDAVISNGFETAPLTNARTANSGGFNCDDIDVREVEKRIGKQTFEVAQRVHGGAKTYSGAANFKQLARKARDEYKKKLKEDFDVVGNTKSKLKDDFKAMIKREKSVPERMSDYAKEVYDDVNPFNRVKKTLQPKDPPFKDLINDVFSCLDTDRIAKEGSRCTGVIREPGGNGYIVRRRSCDEPREPGGPGKGLSEWLNSFDPNEIYGPEGVTEARLIGKEEKLTYTIRFENLEDASAPARSVRIDNPLPEGLRAQSFVLKEIGFGDTTIQLPPTNRIRQRFELGAEYNFQLLDLVAGINAITNEAFWRFSTIDPESGNATLDPFGGFLPPNDSTGRGEGFVTYDIYLEPGVAAGTVISNQADIYFDQNEVISTNVWSNTVVSANAQSQVNSLPPASAKSFLVSWNGSAGEGSAGIQGYDVYFAKNNGEYELWLQGTTATSAVFAGGESNATYSFFSVLTTLEGTAEARPGGPDAATTVQDVVTDLAPETDLQLGAVAYPNPGNGLWNLDYVAERETSLMLYDFSGRVLESRRLQPGNGVSIQLDAQAYGPGMYLLKLHDGNEQFTLKLIKK